MRIAYSRTNGCLYQVLALRYKFHYCYCHGRNNMVIQHVLLLLFFDRTDGSARCTGCRHIEHYIELNSRIFFLKKVDISPLSHYTGIHWEVVYNVVKSSKFMVKLIYGKTVKWIKKKQKYMVKIWMNIKLK